MNDFTLWSCGVFCYRHAGIVSANLLIKPGFFIKFYTYL